MNKGYINNYVIETGIGLQDVDKLTNSTYFINEANRYTKGEISLDELDNIITSYYKSKPKEEFDRSEDADKIAVRIAKCISNDSFVFSVGQLISIHRFLFDGVFKHAGRLRTYNFYKNEWVLGGASVVYGDYNELEATLQYDFDQERKFDYSNLNIDEVIEHLAFFISNLWQIHVFEEGNTRTTAVFIIKYLNSLGFDITNDIFAKNAWYFRNSLVRANYTNISKHIYRDRSFLIMFLKNLLKGEKNILSNRDLLIENIIYTKTGKRESRIIDLIKENPNINADEIAQELGVSIRTIRSALKSLKDNGKIERVGSKKSGKWMLIE